MSIHSVFQRSTSFKKGRMAESWEIILRHDRRNANETSEGRSNRDETKMNIQADKDQQRTLMKEENCWE